MASESRAAADQRDAGAGRERDPGAVLLAAALPLAALAVYCAAAIGLWHLAGSRAARPTVPQMDARRCPWLTPADAAAINSGVETAARGSLFDRDLCSRVERSYRESPWVDRVVAVRRRFPDCVEVELVVRQPYAVVHRDGLYHLVDIRGCRLPVAPSARPDARYPLIEGAKTAPPAPGEVWNDECVSDALRLAELLSDVLSRRGPGGRLTLIDVSKPARGHDLRPQMIARTASGAEIDWGSFNEQRTREFPSVSDKRAELERQLDLIPDLSAVSRIRVRFRDGVIVRRQEPLAAGAIGMVP
ncbi:MAG TPA: hypothetical protein PK280_15425 [Planctomycetota bacterium]|nr:hypothetical protein [Planctomycetota bacterium]